MLPCIKKAMVEVGIKQLKDSIITHNILCLQQKGFKEKHSTETALQIVINDWLSAKGMNRITGALFYDF